MGALSWALSELHAIDQAMVDVGSTKQRSTPWTTILIE
jgi:hypothetical protein